MSRKLEIFTDHNDEPREYAGSCVIKNGICILDLFKTNHGTPEVIKYTSEYAMIQQIVKDYSNGYMVVDKGAI